MHTLTSAGSWFCDAHGRRVLLRGVNLGGSSKLPTTPPGASHLLASLDPAEPISFIGRPFPLEQADEHFGRLRRWGFNLLRLVTTWEALEHAGPGVYDETYLAWLSELVARADAYGLYVIVDFHQDVWGRWSGGDGAPHWTYSAAGLAPAGFDACEAAVTMARRLPAYQPMSWPSNYARFAAQTMFTLFLGGSDFAPGAAVDGEPIQAFLQRHFLAMAGKVAAALAAMPHVLGYGFINELSSGYIGTRLDTTGRVIFGGPVLSSFDGMVLAAGMPRRALHRRLIGAAPVPAGTRMLNPDGVRAWREGAPDLWQEAGVWEVRGGVPVLLRPDHFQRVGGRVVDAHRDYVHPFAQRFATTVQAAHPGALIFVENGALGERPEQPWAELGIAGLVNATHWYDAVTLFTRRATPWFSYDVYAMRPVVGATNVRRMLAGQLAAIKAASAATMGGCPTLIGEFGLPFDLDGRRGQRTGDYRAHAALLAGYYAILDELLISSALWNYTADNDHQWGDQWNREDLSIFSRDDLRHGDDGARALRGFCRPYARVTAGTPRLMRFDHANGVFELRYEPEPGARQPTEIYVPTAQYPGGYTVTLASGRAERDEAAQLLRVWADGASEQVVVIRRGTLPAGPAL